MTDKPELQIFGLGGTIAMAPNQEGAGVRPSLTANDLIKAAPELSDIAQIRAETLSLKGSANLAFHEIVSLCERAEKCTSDGIVVTQGTDTMEETAFLANLLYRGSCPLVFPVLCVLLLSQALMAGPTCWLHR